LSIVFDARKHAEQSKRAREATAGTLRSPGSEIPSSDSPDTRLDRGTGTSSLHRGGGARIARSDAAWTRDIAEGAVKQETAIVRSLLRTSRSERLPQESDASRQSGKVEPAILVLRKNPVYPALAKQDVASGSLEVRFRISPEGKVYGAKLVKGSPVLARAVLEAVEQWSYEPARLNGAPVDSPGSTTFDFTMN
jgi:TonB family protein